MDALSKMVETARKKCGYTQEQLAKVAGVSRPRISDLETGKQHATLDDLEKLAAHLRGKLDIRLAQSLLAERKMVARHPQLREAEVKYGKTRATHLGKPAFFPLAQLPLPSDSGITLFTTDNPPGSPIIASKLIVEDTADICHGIQVLALVRKDPPTWHICNYCEGVMDEMDVYAIVGAEK
jgi:transcriptional regulator with XRE-family HTH domain